MKNIQFAAFADEAGRPLETQIAALQRNNIPYLEIRFVGDKNVSELTTDEAKEIRKKLDDGGIKTWSIGSPTGKIALGDPFAPHLDAFKRQLEIADILGATRYRLFSFYEAGENLNAVAEKLNRMLDEAEGSGVVLCHENEKKIYGDTDVRCEKLLKAIPRLRAVYDPANFIQCGVETLGAWERLAPYVDYMHIKDCGADGKVLLPGKGIGNLRELLRRYMAQGGGTVTLEPHLTRFIGLEKLERGDIKDPSQIFPDGNAAFDAAASALRAIVAEIE
ncbi:MAG: sugar phosphate isomerase/epimerase [Oscillospiraceae bacterium]|nr:sugar phosphate isomerase/epimerase [Oscillospiraceae bacterium]